MCCTYLMTPRCPTLSEGVRVQTSQSTKVQIGVRQGSEVGKGQDRSQIYTREKAGRGLRLVLEFCREVSEV